MASLDIGKAEAVAWIKEHYQRGASCLDVGACGGRWWRLVGDYLTMDAVEIFEPYVKTGKLYKKYKNVFIADIRGFEYEHYDLIIFGDVLEHMSVEDAQKVIRYAWNRCDNMLIAVPYGWKQGAIHGNPHEVHIQDDLTPELFDSRYPGFTPIYQTDLYAYYVRCDK